MTGSKEDGADTFSFDSVSKCKEVDDEDGTVLLVFGFRMCTFTTVSTDEAPDPLCGSMAFSSFGVKVERRKLAVRS